MNDGIHSVPGRLEREPELREPLANEIIISSHTTAVKQGKFEDLIYGQFE